MKKPNSKGFSPLHTILLLTVIGIIGFTGWYVWHANQNTTTNAKTDNVVTGGSKNKGSTDVPPTTTYDTSITQNIKNFDNASNSLKKALVNTYYAEAKRDCDTENANVSDDAKIDYVMSVQKMVRDNFAGVQFCGSGGTSILANVNGEWKKVGSLAMAPSCTLVDQYKISKEVASTCYLNDGTSREVTYI